MPKTNCIELPTGETIPILYEDRAVLAIDKPRGWMLVPFSWQKTSRNLQAALVSSIAAKDFWARSRNLKFLRFVHRLDAETSGVLLMAKSQGALNAYGDLFESRQMEKVYLAVVHGTPKQNEWVCRLKLGPDPRQRGRMIVDLRQGKSAETSFRVIQSRGGAHVAGQNDSIGGGARPHPSSLRFAEAGPSPLPQEREQCSAAVGKPDNRSIWPSAGTASPSPGGEGRGEGGRRLSTKSGRQDAGPLRQAGCPPPQSPATISLIEAHPFTGRTHQIRVHLAESGCPIVGDELYSPPSGGKQPNLGLRAVSLAYEDPFTRRRIHIKAAADDFCHAYGFANYDSRPARAGSS